MLTGRRAFEGKTPASVIAAVLASEPEPVSTIKPDIPPALDHVIRTCLAKDPDARWQVDAGCITALKWLQGNGAAVPPPFRAGGRRAAWLVQVAVLCLRWSQAWSHSFACANRMLTLTQSAGSGNCQ